MQTKHLCVLIHIWTKGGDGSPWNRSKPSSKIFLLTIPRRCFFCGSYNTLFLSCFVILSCASVYWCLVVTSWEKAELLALVCDVLLWSRHFPIGILGQLWCLVVSIPDLCPFFFTLVKSLIYEDKKHGLVCGIWLWYFLIILTWFYFLQQINIQKLIWHRRKKTCIRGFANNTGEDQPAHLRSLISASVVCLLEVSYLNLLQPHFQFSS